MDTTSGSYTNSSGLDSGLQNCKSEEDLELMMDRRKRKRMISNRESARRSRLRKRNHLDGLISQLAQLRKEKNQILGGLDVTAQHCMSVEAENAILRAQAAELSHRLHNLNQISSMFTLANSSLVDAEESAYYMAEPVGFMNHFCDNQSQPIFMAAALADAGGFQY